MQPRSSLWIVALSTSLLVACTGGSPSIDLPEQQSTNTVDPTTGGAIDDAVPDTEPTQSNPLGITDALVSIPRIAAEDAPQINGDLININPATNRLTGEWETAVQSDTNKQLLAIDSLMVSNGVDTSQDIAHRWAAMHDGTYLYLLVISDDDGDYRFDTQEARKPWKDDDLELYFDGNASLLPSYDGVDDFHMHINLVDPLTSQGNSSEGDSKKILQAVNSAPLPSDLSFSVGLQRGPLLERRLFRSDIYEIRISLSELNITVGQPFGIELQINDDDNGGTRDTKWGWQHPPGSDLAWENPSLLATAILQ